MREIDEEHLIMQAHEAVEKSLGTVDYLRYLRIVYGGKSRFVRPSPRTVNDVLAARAAERWVARRKRYRAAIC